MVGLPTCQQKSLDLWNSFPGQEFKLDLQNIDAYLTTGPKVITDYLFKVFISRFKISELAMILAALMVLKSVYQTYRTDNIKNTVDILYNITCIWYLKI